MVRLRTISNILDDHMDQKLYALEPTHQKMRIEKLDKPLSNFKTHLVWWLPLLQGEPLCYLLDLSMKYENSLIGYKK